MHLQRLRIDKSRFPTQTEYPFNLTLWQQAPTFEFSHPLTIFAGENGTGKSTLLKALCRRCGIHIWEGMHRTRFEVNPYEGMLHQTLDITWRNGSVPGSFFAPDLFRNFSQLVDEWASTNPALLQYFGGKSLLKQSHGQSCMAYFNSMYKVKGLHFLDEPETALSPKTQLELLALLERISAAGHAQFVMATHSPILMSCGQAQVYRFDTQGIEAVAFQETEHYRVYKEFFETH